MTIEKNRQGETLEHKLSGWLDTESSPLLAEEISALDDTFTKLIIDCSKLEYMSSARLRQLVAAYKRVNGHLALTHVSDEIMTIISMTGLNKKLHIEA